MEVDTTKQIESIILAMKGKTGISIPNLKPSFVKRRILYRMRIIGISDYDEYAKLLSTSFDEAKLLYAAFSINVTKFFRDPYVWEKIEQEIIPNFLNSPRFSPIQVWSCACASGEEPYSISMSFNKSLKGKHSGYQIYGTDISNSALTHAKKGVYTKENLINVNPQQLAAYFDKISDNQFQVKPEIRSRIEFDKVNMLKTSGKLYDMIICRNVLIYYDKDTHEIIFKKFFDALKKDGILIIGQEESMMGTQGGNYFDLIHPKERIYQKKSS